MKRYIYYHTDYGTPNQKVVVYDIFYEVSKDKAMEMLEKYRTVNKMVGMTDQTLRLIASI